MLLPANALPSNATAGAAATAATSASPAPKTSAAALTGAAASTGTATLPTVVMPAGGWIAGGGGKGWTGGRK